jgi:hypothetical protein
MGLGGEKGGGGQQEGGGRAWSDQREMEGARREDAAWPGQTRAVAHLQELVMLRQLR